MLSIALKAHSASGLCQMLCTASKSACCATTQSAWRATSNALHCTKERMAHHLMKRMACHVKCFAWRLGTHGAPRQMLCIASKRAWRATSNALRGVKERMARPLGSSLTLRGARTKRSRDSVLVAIFSIAFSLWRQRELDGEEKNRTKAQPNTCFSIRGYR